MLQHVTLEVAPDQVRDCVAFWALLGFTVTEPPPGLRDLATWVSRAGTQIHLLYAEHPVTMPEGHAAVVVEDYDAAAAALREAGFTLDPRREHWNAPRAFVRSPAGHLVELMAAPAPG